MAIKRYGKELTPREQAAYVRKITGWTVKEYQREYDRLRNRARNFERINNIPRGSINVADMLAGFQRSKYMHATAGEMYTGTNLYQAVMAAPSVSTGARISARATAQPQSIGLQLLERQFAGLLTKSVYSQEIKTQVAALAQRGELNYQTYSELLKRYANLSAARRAAIEVYNKTVEDFGSRLEPGS